MKDCLLQPMLFDKPQRPSPTKQNDIERSLDELFNLARLYRTGDAYRNLINFVAKFRFYSPYNALLIHVQNCGAKFVAPANRWKRDYDRNIKATARPLVILQPMGPVMFVFDVSDTEPDGPDARSLPEAVENPFEVRAGSLDGELESTIENAIRDGVRTQRLPQGSQSAGSIQQADGERTQRFLESRGRDGVETFINIPVRYELLINANLSDEAQYATMVHELAHLYCGHLGTPNPTWWPDRRRLGTDAMEFEAESVSYIVCMRLGIDTPSEEYLGGYLKDREPPDISLECVMKFAGLIESMGLKSLKPRKED